MAIMTSYLKTTILLAGLTAIFMAVGFLLGGKTGLIIAFVMALGVNLFSYWNSGDIVLSMYGAREVDAYSAPEFHGIVARLAERAEKYLRERLVGCAAGKLRVVVHHSDLLALARPTGETA